MVSTPQINAPAGQVISVFSQTAQNMRALQAQSIAVYNIPTHSMESTAAGEIIAYRRIAQQIEVTQAQTLAVYRGRISNPRLRAWTFTLDGHDFYVLRLGDTLTKVYDVYSEQWVEWTSDIQNFWRANCGMTWIGGQGLGQTYGTGIVVGDDTFGLLWLLDPYQAYDDHPDATNLVQQVPFPRVVTAQVLANGRQYLPCYALFLDGDNYGLTATDFVPEITLETSDDQGRTFDNQGTLSVVVDYQQDNPYNWQSLGQIASPGRIFRFTDNGVFTRIDSLQMNDDA